MARGERVPYLPWDIPVAHLPLVGGGEAVVVKFIID
jgi:hypothetical protein